MDGPQKDNVWCDDTWNPVTGFEVAPAAVTAPAALFGPPPASQK